MSVRVYCFLKAAGNDIAGESTVESIGGVDVSQAIECEEYQEGVQAAQDKASRRPTGTRVYDPIVVAKWVDKASPLLAKALTNTEPVEAEFFFFRPSKEDAQQEHFFTTKIEDARISELKRFLPTGSEDVSRAGKPPMEKISMVFSKITWSHVPGSTEHSDDWRQQG